MNPPAPTPVVRPVFPPETPDHDKNITPGSYLDPNGNGTPFYLERNGRNLRYDNSGDGRPDGTYHNGRNNGPSNEANAIGSRRADGFDAGQNASHEANLKAAAETAEANKQAAVEMNRSAQLAQQMNAAPPPPTPFDVPSPYAPPRPR